MVTVKFTGPDTGGGLTMEATSMVPPLSRFPYAPALLLA